MLNKNGPWCNPSLDPGWTIWACFYPLDLFQVKQISQNIWHAILGDEFREKARYHLWIHDKCFRYQQLLLMCTSLDSIPDPSCLKLPSWALTQAFSKNGTDAIYGKLGNEFYDPLCFAWHIEYFLSLKVYWNGMQTSHTLKNSFLADFRRSWQSELNKFIMPFYHTLFYHFEIRVCISDSIFFRNCCAVVVYV